MRKGDNYCPVCGESLALDRRLFDLQGFVSSHGFESELVGDLVVVLIPWFKRETGEEGILREPCTNLLEVKRALGY